MSNNVILHVDGANDRLVRLTSTADGDLRIAGVDGVTARAVAVNEFGHIITADGGGGTAVSATTTSVWNGNTVDALGVSGVHEASGERHFSVYISSDTNIKIAIQSAHGAEVNPIWYEDPTLFTVIGGTPMTIVLGHLGASQLRLKSMDAAVITAVIYGRN